MTISMQIKASFQTCPTFINNTLPCNYCIYLLSSMIRMIVCIALLLFVGRATLVITNPLVTDFTDNQLKYFYANFGEVPYGKTQSFDLLLLDHNLCGNISEIEHLTRPTYLVIKISTIDTCSVTKRAINAQLLGAKGIIIATPSADYARGNVIESDDGNGKKVHITCLFITNESFDKLKKLSKIEIISKFPVPKEKVSTLSLFLSASKRKTYAFLREFKAEYKLLKDYVTIEPIYHTIDCETCNPQNCYFQQFCCFDYENYQSNVGSKIIREQLHQYTIFQQKGAEKWMEYMNLFDQYCGSDWSNIDQCTRQILKQLNMEDGYLPNPGETLRVWRNREIRLGFDSFPEVAVNNMIYRGNFDAEQIVDTLCASLVTPPKYCNERSAEVSETTGKKSSSNHVVIILLVTIFALIVLVLIGVLFYRKFIKSELTKDMSSRVSELVANYANKVSAQKKRHREKMMESFDEEL